MVRDILLLDNNVVNKLNHDPSRERLEANLRATGREFWPTAMNVMEALKSRDGVVRARLLRILSGLAGENHAFPLPTECLKEIAKAFAAGETLVTWAEPRFTSVFRKPETVDNALAEAAREHLIEVERAFDATHQRAVDELLPVIRKLGGRETWSTVGEFLDEMWSTPDHLGDYLDALWEEWGLPGPTPIDVLLADRAWALYFEGWGAAMYARMIAHPQPPKVESADLGQLVYSGCARSTVIVSDDQGFRDLANAIVRGRHARVEVVSFSAVTT